MNTLITGGAGFIGSHLAEFLLKEGHQVSIIDDLSGGYINNVPEKSTFFNVSILDYKMLSTIFLEGKFDYVYHLAAYAAESLSHYIRRFNYENNLIGSINLINLSIQHGIKCFVFTSSAAVYGHSSSLLKEDEILQPMDPYGIAKLAAEFDLRAAFSNFGLNSIVFRPHNVFGPGQNINDKYRNVIGIFLNQSLSGKAMTVFGDGEQTRTFTYIDDIVPTIARSVFMDKAYNMTFNLGGDTLISVNHLSEMIAELLNIPLKRRFLGARNESKHNSIAHDLANSFFEPPCPTPIKEGIRKTIDWIKSNDVLSDRFKTMDVEIPFGLPEGW